MSKGLETLEEIKKVKTITPYRYVQDEYSNEINTIEKELQEGEMWKAKYTMLEKEHIGLMLEKGALKKALEIVKQYIHIYCVAPNDRGGVRIWFTQDGKHYIDMPQEQYDLLKEGLL